MSQRKPKASTAAHTGAPRSPAAPRPADPPPSGATLEPGIAALLDAITELEAAEPEAAEPRPHCITPPAAAACSDDGLAELLNSHAGALAEADADAAPCTAERAPPAAPAACSAVAESDPEACSSAALHIQSAAALPAEASSSQEAASEELPALPPHCASAHAAPQEQQATTTRPVTPPLPATPQLRAGSAPREPPAASQSSLREEKAALSSRNAPLQPRPPSPVPQTDPIAAGPSPEATAACGERVQSERRPATAAAPHDSQPTRSERSTWPQLEGSCSAGRALHSSDGTALYSLTRPLFAAAGPIATQVWQLGALELPCASIEAVVARSLLGPLRVRNAAETRLATARPCSARLRWGKDGAGQQLLRRARHLESEQVAQRTEQYVRAKRAAATFWAGDYAADVWRAARGPAPVLQ